MDIRADRPYERWLRRQQLVKSNCSWDRLTISSTTGSIGIGQKRWRGERDGYRRGKLQLYVDVWLGHGDSAYSTRVNSFRKDRQDRLRVKFVRSKIRRIEVPTTRFNLTLSPSFIERPRKIARGEGLLLRGGVPKVIQI